MIIYDMFHSLLVINQIKNCNCMTSLIFIDDGLTTTTETISAQCLVPLGFRRLLWQRRASAGPTQTESWSDPGWSFAAGGRGVLKPVPQMPQ